MRSQATDCFDSKWVTPESIAVRLRSLPTFLSDEGRNECKYERSLLKIKVDLRGSGVVQFLYYLGNKGIARCCLGEWSLSAHSPGRN